MSVQLARRSFSRTDFHRMVAAGILAPDDRVELVDGEVVEMGPIGSRYAACVDRLAALFWQRLGKRVVVRVQNPLVLGSCTEVQPDLCLVRNRDDYFQLNPPDEVPNLRRHIMQLLEKSEGG